MAAPEMLIVAARLHAADAQLGDHVVRTSNRRAAVGTEQNGEGRSAGGSHALSEAANQC